LRWEEWPVLNQALHRGNERFGGFGFQKTSLGARIPSLAPQLGKFVQGGYQHRNRRGEAGDFPGGFKTIAPWHHDIHDDEIGLKVASAFNGLDAICGFPADDPMSLGFENFPEQAANSFMIVSDHDTKFRKVTVNGRIVIDLRHHKTTKTGPQPLSNTAIRVGTIKDGRVQA
jgi:hypothetical protein